MAVGAEQKNTFTYLKVKEAFVSPHIGDVENAEVMDVWESSRQHYAELFNIDDIYGVVCDMHPEYITSKWAKDFSVNATDYVGFTEVQHHHAHIASVMSENKLTGPVIGFAFDGTGFGADGAIWGGEVLVSNLRDYERFANLAYVPLVTGAGAIKDPSRMAFGCLYEFDLLDHPAIAKFVKDLGESAETYESMINEGINTPYTSSLGRNLDALSAILGICKSPTYEGEAAILLEACAWQASDEDMKLAGEPYSIDILKNTATEHSTAHDTSVVILDQMHLFKGVLDDMKKNIPVRVIARKIHDCISSAVVMCAQLANSFYGIKDCVLSGGVWQNRYLAQKCVNDLAGSGFRVALNVELPPNDGCISYGQAVVQYNKNNN